MALMYKHPLACELTNYLNHLGCFLGINYWIGDWNDQVYLGV